MILRATYSFLQMILAFFATGSDPAETSAKLNRDLDKISHWAKRWKITFNSGKSKDIIFSNKCLNNSPLYL